MTHRSHEKWTSEEDKQLVDRFRNGRFPPDIARELGRTELAIRHRLAKYGLLPAITEEDLAHFKVLRENAQISTGTSTDITSMEADAVVSVKDNADSATLDIQQAFHRFHFVYAIVNPRSQIYIGYSGNVWHRVRQHNNGQGAKATQKTGPWFPFSIVCLAAEDDARQLERELKRNFTDFARRSEISLREVLAQIGVPFVLGNLVLLRS